MKPSLTQTLLTGLLTFVISAVLILTAAPLLSINSRSAHKAKAINNLKQIGIALGEFESNYNRFPLTELPPEFLAENPDFQPLDRTDSNYLLGHLIRTNCVDTETIFSFGHSKAQNPDDDFSTDQKILEAGECQFSYISAAGDVTLTWNRISNETPLAFAAVVPQTAEFDPTAFRNESIYLRRDSSVTATKLSKGKHPKPLWKGHKGLSILDSGPGTLWENGSPRVHHPLSYQHRELAPERTAWNSGGVFLVFIIGTILVIYFFFRFLLTPQKED